jgi:hypothetical protein
VRTTLESTLAWWIARPIFGQVIVGFLALANKRLGVLGGVTDLVQGSAEGRRLRRWRTLVAFVSARLLCGRRALLTGEPINWVPRLIVQGADGP